MNSTTALESNGIDRKSVDKKSMKKRIKHFLKTCKSPGAPMQSQSKLSKIQQIILKCNQQYQHIIANEVSQQVEFIFRLISHYESLMSERTDIRNDSFIKEYRS